MQLPRLVAENAKHAYQIADEKRIIRGKNERSVIAACIIFACRNTGAERSFSEVCKALKINKKELGSVFTLIKKVVQDTMKVAGHGGQMGQTSTNMSAEGMLSRYCNYLDLGNAVLNASKHISNLGVEKSAIDGRSPVSIAAGVLWFTCVLFSKTTSAKDISTLASVSESTMKL
jgi:transcription initiation factor TFIIB